jgi:hypothetical protein
MAHDDLFAGLRALARDAFPKRCPTCGRTYESAEAYFRDTQPVRGQSGLHASRDDDDRAIVELFRNCACGSTLMNVFDNRRNDTEPGRTQRERFDTLLRELEKLGLETALARAELLKALRGEPSEILARLRDAP